MTIPYIEVKLRELISDAEGKYNLYKYMGWDVEWIVQLRHIYLKTLLKNQLRNFNK